LTHDESIRNVIGNDLFDRLVYNTSFINYSSIDSKLLQSFNKEDLEYSRAYFTYNLNPNFSGFDSYFINTEDLF
jgi:hypothetical protein